MFNKEREKDSHHNTDNLKFEATIFRQGGRQAVSSEYKVHKFQKFNGWERNTKEHLARFLDFIGGYASDAEFSKSLIDRAYTWYLSLKKGSIQDWHIWSPPSTPNFFTEEKYTLASWTGPENI